MGLILESRSRLILMMLDELLSDVVPLNVFFQIGQLIADIESFKVLAELVIDFIMLRFFKHRDN